MSLAVPTARLLLLCCTVLTPLPCLATPAEDKPPSDLRLNEPQPTTILVRVVGHGAMVLGREVGSARVTITHASPTTASSSTAAKSRSRSRRASVRLAFAPRALTR